MIHLFKNNVVPTQIKKMQATVIEKAFLKFKMKKNLENVPCLRKNANNKCVSIFFIYRQIKILQNSYKK